MDLHGAQVGAMLAALPQDKWVLTNCNEKHAKLALQTMGIESHFKYANDVCGAFSTCYAGDLQRDSPLCGTARLMW